MKNMLFAIFVVTIFFIGAFFYLKEPAPQKEDPVPSSEETAKDASYKDGALLALIKTARGDIELALYPKVAPKTVNNFVKLAKDGFYNGIKFHRVISSFMIQGGDPLSRIDSTAVGTGGPGYAFEDEINPRSLGLSTDAIAKLERAGYVYNYSLESLPADVGALAMANSGPNTNGSQFFIVTERPQPHLYGLHTVFGKVVEGMEVARSVKQGDVITTIEIGGE